jgi:non-ribosomal peptide synthase protein (TIGR01720 family)
MVQVITSWTGSDIAWLDLEGHGREPLFDDLDLTRTVGWFTSVFPICLRLPRLSRPGDAIKSIKEQLAAVPGRVAYGLLRYLSPDPGVRALMRSVPKPLIAFNYFGQVDADLAPDALLWPSPHLIGANRSPQQARSHILEINAMVRGGQLQIGWTYATEIHRRTTIETLASQYLDALRALVRHCRSAGEAGYTPSDFPLAGVDQKQLDRLIGSFRRSARRPQL